MFFVIANSINLQYQIKITNRNSKDTTYLLLIRGERSRNFKAPQSVLVSMSPQLGVNT